MAQDKGAAAKAAPQKPTEHKASVQAPSGKPPKGGGPLPDGCHAWGCKAQATRFNFCEEHYEHFKFGLIKKTGEPVSDYEKKLGHFLAHKGQSARKSA